MSISLVNEQLIEALIKYKSLIDSNASVFESLQSNEVLENLEDKDGTKPYFLLCAYQDMILYTTFNYTIETLLDLANEICTTPLLSGLNLTIYKTTTSGGTPLYIDSPLGMMYHDA